MNCRVVIIPLLIGASVCGCVSKRKAQANIEAAFRAGQERGMMLAEQEARGVVRIMGPVRLPVVEWRDGLTLAQAIVEADYTPSGNPKAIILHRQGVRIPIEPALLLVGKDQPLEPGDMIEIQP